MAWRLKRSNCPKWNFFSKNNKIFMYLLALFILQNSKRIFRLDPKLSGCAIFRPKMANLSWANFFGTNHYYYFHLTICPFHCAKFQKNPSSRSRVMRMNHFWAQNGPFAETRIFSENLLMNLVPFIHAYLHAKNQSQILMY